jgi:hypothetical protein
MKPCLNLEFLLDIFRNDVAVKQVDDPVAVFSIGR